MTMRLKVCFMCILTILIVTIVAIENILFPYLGFAFILIYLTFTLVIDYFITRLITREPVKYLFKGGLMLLTIVVTICYLYSFIVSL